MIIKTNKKLDISKFKDKDFKYSQEEIDSWLNLENTFLFTLEEENKIYGFSLFMKTDIDSYDLLYIYITKDKRNQNLATKLLNASINLLKDLKISIFLEVSSENISAIKLYEKLEFKKISVRKRYYKDDTDALIYKLEV